MFSTGNVLPHVHAEAIQCALQDRVLGRGATPGERRWRGILLTSGGGSIAHEDQVHALSAPCLAWIPWADELVFRVRAGSVGYQFTVGEPVLADAIGHNPESTDLRLLADRRVISTLHDARETAADAAYAFDLIVRETHYPKSGSWSMMQAQLRAILVLLWRMSGGERFVPHGQGDAARVLQHFRQLLEVHFRDRWTVTRYADAIGVSPDRLHDICRRSLAKPPLQLIHERVIHEARLRLERSTQSVEQVSASLGFRDVGHFSRFFSSKVGLPPGAYRNNAALAATDGTEMPPSTYADWP